MLFRLMLVFTLSFTILACATPRTMSPNFCARADWFDVGRKDGEQGRDSSYALKHERSCEQWLNNVDYKKGLDEGIRSYCSPAGAYSVGAAGNIFENVCSPIQEKSVRKYYEQGLRTNTLIVSHEASLNELKAEKNKIEKDNTVLGDVKKAFAIVSGRSQTEDLDRKVEDAEDLLHRQSLLAPAGSVVPTSKQYQLGQMPIINDAPIAGILTAATIGFGLGHGVEGIYRERGWKWTAIDIANIVGFTTIGQSCNETRPEQGPSGETIYTTRTKKTLPCVVGPLLLVGGFFASRVFQALEVNEYGWNPYGVTVIPEKNGGAAFYVTFQW